MKTVIDAAPDANLWLFTVGNRDYSSKNKPLDGDDRAIKVDDEFADHKWFHRVGSALDCGVPVQSSKMMARFRWHGAPPSDVHRWNSYLLVSDRFKDVVDGIEPRLHQFFPVELIGNHKSLVTTMYVLVPNVALRCFSKLSIGYHPIGWENWGDHVWHLEGSSRDSRLILEDTKTKGHHLWIAVDLWNRPIMVSNTLRRGLIDANLTNMEFAPVESRERMLWMLPEIVKSPFAVDPPWVAWLADE